MPDNVPRCELHHLPLSSDGKSHLAEHGRLETFVGPCLTPPSVPTAEDRERAIKWLRSQAERMCFTNDFRPGQSQSLAEEFSAVREAAHKAGLAAALKEME